MIEIPASHADAAWLVFPVMALAVVGVIVAAVRHEKKRTEEIKALARRLGMEFHAKGEMLRGMVFTAFPLFNTGRGRTYSNVLFENKGPSETAMFDYRYTTGGGKNNHTTNQTVVAFRKAGVTLPLFTLAPEHLFHRIGEKFGMQDIDFRGNDEFSSSYLLQGEDETAIRKLFEGRAVRFFARNPKWNVQAAGEWLVVFRAAKRPKAEDLPEFLKNAIEVARAFDMV